jgi:chemotaxis protein CheD
MYRHKITQFEQEVVTIHPGEYYACREDTIISTILGSCVAVGLYDPSEGAGGLNHFMLPGEVAREDLIKSPNAKYGMYAMELLVNELMKLGVKKREIKAKVFGGGSVLKLPGAGSMRIPRSNIDFAFDYLAREGIPVLSSDVGGQEPRKIFFFSRTGKVLLKRIGGNLAGLVEKEEERYLDSLRASPKEGEITIF